ncbi:prephenate dehydratase domain-containing protein [Brevundimonas subvibrioides]|uniref:prephenate dehydratase n=1 Tax=Brevundimonas subvibrioides (strain ATCC 15264 / DSM 4735 / LMG 14903 / NBRC 16000 / CB 81) TaxID=633149 RepID=D9QGR7_BRESC|nr:prephenate dehydratase domain-containing protein [Brevundimonas subvibrioides]ADL00883.1 Prephenate dehydratase [Brevundimonas subvibrioides ATCC 15264]
MTEAAIGRPAGDDRGGRTAFQGAPGAFSHEACVELRPWDEHVPFETFEDAIAAVKSGACDCALIPVENSTIGDVEPAATLVRTSGLAVVGEAWRPIRMALMALDGVELDELRTVASHPIALAQCSGKLTALNLTMVEAFDTAGAARDVSEAGDRTRAALAPVAAAEVYGLSILRLDLQDSADNRTRFVLLAREAG